MFKHCPKIVEHICLTNMMYKLKISIDSSYTFLAMVMLLTITMYGDLRAQDSLKHEIKIKEAIDTLLLDWDKEHWSILALANFKDNNFRVKNGTSTLKYAPKNRSGIGIGFATSKLRIDLILNIKTDKEERTDRFDAQGDILLGNTLALFRLQKYDGFNVTNTDSNESEFRHDIGSLSIGLGGLRIMNPQLKPLNMIYSGVHTNYKTDGSLLLGAFAKYYSVRADSSIVPHSSRDLFNEQAQVLKSRQFAIGVNAGYSYFIDLKSNFFIFMTVAPGIGLSFKKVEAETETYVPDNLWDLSLYFRISVGYNQKRYYIDVSVENDYNYTYFDYGNNGIMNSTKAKLSVGWKFARNKNK